MTDISAFPTIANVLWSGNNIVDMIASGAITAGQVVAFDASGESMTVRAAIAESGEFPLGVALYSVASGAHVAVATVGCIVYVANADDTATIDAGDFLETNDNAVGGTVSVAAVAATGGATVTVHHNVVGRAVDDIAASGTGRMIVIPGAMTQANSS